MEEKYALQATQCTAFPSLTEADVKALVAYMKPFEGY